MNDRVQRIDKPHHDRVDPAADITGDSAVQNADDEADDAGNHGNEQRDANTHHRAHEQVASEVVGAEQVHAGESRRV